MYKWINTFNSIILYYEVTKANKSNFPIILTTDFFDVARRIDLRPTIKLLNILLFLLARISDWPHVSSSFVYPIFQHVLTYVRTGPNFRKTFDDENFWKVLGSLGFGLKYIACACVRLLLWFNSFNWSWLISIESQIDSKIWIKIVELVSSYDTYYIRYIRHRMGQRITKVKCDKQRLPKMCQYILNVMWFRIQQFNNINFGPLGCIFTEFFLIYPIHFRRYVYIVCKVKTTHITS